MPSGVTPFRFLLPAFAALAPAAAQAFEPRLPFPVLGAEARPAVYDSYALPVAPWRPDGLPTVAVEGQVDRRAWRLDAPGATLMEVIAPLRDQLAAQGYEVLLDCEARACGGFDFRFNTEVLPEPGMHVDLNEFRFVSARRGAAAVSLLVSRSASAAFVQIITVGPAALPAPVTAPETAPVPHDPAPHIAAGGAGTDLLDAGLPLALEDLVFDSGSATLAAGDYPSLALIAAWLGADASRRLILVGHTDLSGAMEANIALSKRRAAAVREALIRGHGIAPGRLSAEGAGPLAPRATNATEEGRQKNRRVEAVPAPT